MRLHTIFRACTKILSTKNPSTKVETEDGDIVTYKELSSELERLDHWCYKGEVDVQKVIRCKNCIHYKRYRKKTVKNPYEHRVFCACSIDRLKRQPEFFCSNGEERD